MNISFTINLNFDEKRAFGKQCEKQIQDYVKLLKNTTFGKALFKEI